MLGSVRIDVPVQDAPEYIIVRNDWRATARAYLQWVRDNCSEDTYRLHRKRIGDAWRAADESHGSLRFYMN
jgi:hypothetical protein